jgi:hypothetical protein
VACTFVREAFRRAHEIRIIETELPGSFLRMAEKAKESKEPVKPI